MPSVQTSTMSSPVYLQLESDICSAIRKGYFRQVREQVARGFDVNVRDVDNDRRTALMWCAMVSDEGWSLSLARLLLESGARAGLIDAHGLTALHYASLLGRTSLAVVLLGALDFDVNQADAARGNTALHYAAALGNAPLCRALVNCCARYGVEVDVPNGRGGYTALALALKGGHEDCAEILRASGRVDKARALRLVSRDNNESERDDAQNPIERHRNKLPNVQGTSNKFIGLSRTAAGGMHNGHEYPSQNLPRTRNSSEKCKDMTSMPVTDNAQWKSAEANRLRMTVNRRPSRSVSVLSSVAKNGIGGGDPEEQPLQSTQRKRLESNSVDTDASNLRHQNGVLTNTTITRLRPKSCRPQTAALSKIGNDIAKSTCLSKRRLSVDGGVSCASSTDSSNSTAASVRTLDLRQVRRQPHVLGGVCTRLLTASPIKAANDKDPRSCPEMVVIRSPASPASNDNGVNGTVTGNSAMFLTDWRSKMSDLYRSFDYQFTPSYRRQAVKPVEIHVSNDDVFFTGGTHGADASETDGRTSRRTSQLVRRGSALAGARQTSASSASLDTVFRVHRKASMAFGRGNRAKQAPVAAMTTT